MKNLISLVLCMVTLLMVPCVLLAEELHSASAAYLPFTCTSFTIEVLSACERGAGGGAGEPGGAGGTA